ncbi:ComEA family DNA-binding protein [Paenibacillus sp. PR3]|uniref:ComEA family DNA-binding protein n=1 Tax=Paenibacillus terricola TaxID=2763503 RepID=A0ABR8MQM5_9BACL|nr:ComEA family DNA-binding protein [Paenibacillus terricola]MBD3917905.1 ComEA family DNA-binding protein [Paenibacillus terricola]
MEVKAMFARSESSRHSHPVRLAILIGCIGALLAGFGVYRMKQGTQDSWQPLNESLNALLTEEASGSPARATAAPVDAAIPSAKPNGADASQQAGNNSVATIAVSQTAPNASLPETAQPPSAPAAEESSAVVSAAPDGRIDINHATAQQLDELPGIGPAKAAAIVADREANGPFRSVDDLDRVKGIGAKMIEKLRASVVALP